MKNTANYKKCESTISRLHDLGYTDIVLKSRNSRLNVDRVSNGENLFSGTANDVDNFLYGMLQAHYLMAD